MSEDELLQQAMKAALRLLAYRPRSEAEVRQRLLRRFSSTIVERTVVSLKEQDLLDDVAFSRSWRTMRDSMSPRSAFLLKRELTLKGVDRQAIDEALQDSDDRESAYRAALKAARRLKGEDMATFRRRMWGYLRRRGFSSSIIGETTRRILGETG